MPDDPVIFTVRQCKRIKINWYIDGPWNDVGHVVRDAFRFKAFPKEPLEGILQALEHDMSKPGDIGIEWICNWVSNQTNAVRETVLTPYRSI